MKIRKIITIHDPEASILRRKATPVTQFGGKSHAHRVSGEMSLVMLKHQPPIMGLAANQIGRNMRIIILLGGDTLFNPRVLKRTKSTNVSVEGCASIPGVPILVRRPDGVLAGFQDFNGRERTRRYNGQQARVFLHELDHLDGVLILDKAVEDWGPEEWGANDGRDRPEEDLAAQS